MKDQSKSLAQKCPAPAATHLSAPLLAKERLVADRIRVHAERVGEALRAGRETWIPIVAPCTSTNGGILSWKTAVRFLEGEKSEAERRHEDSLFAWWCENYVVTCIPAAGAASRYLGPLHKLVAEVESQVAGLPELFESAWKADPAGLASSRLDGRQRQVFVVALEGLTPSNEYLRLAEHLRALKGGTAGEDFVRTTSVLVEVLTLGNAASAAALAQDAAKRRAAAQARPTHTQSWDIRRPWLRSLRPRNTAFRKIPRPIANGSARTVVPHLGAAAQATLEAYVAAKTCLRAFGSAPKALVPTTHEGDTFLRLKLVEQTTLLRCATNYLIVPVDQTRVFEAEVASEGERLKEIAINPFDLEGTPFAPAFLRHEGRAPTAGAWKVLEQGRELCTLRFRRDGTPYTGEDGAYSVVSAGHGELLHLFEGMAAANPRAECLHVRNIDNIIGTTGERCEELSVPADVFRIVRDCLEYVRAAVDDFVQAGNHKTEGARLTATPLLEIVDCLSGLLVPQTPRPRDADVVDATGRYVGFSAKGLHGLFRALFHWSSLDESGDAAAWLKLHDELAKPLSVLGVVRKETGDVGGGPVFVDTGDGKRVKICLEMPHAAPEASTEYFGPRGKATHFNPVLVFFELRTHKRAFEGEGNPGRLVDFGQLFDDRFWLLSKKEFRGEPVCYHETVLYELIGNSATTNLLFVEVPRTLFVPHKAIFDSMGQDRRSYGFHETLQELEREA